MSILQQSSQAMWDVSQGEALSMAIGPGPRELSVAEGRLWLTLQGSAEAPAEDIWLAPGQSVHLDSGSRLVIEAWPQAKFQLLVPPAACTARAHRKAKVSRLLPSWPGLAAA